MTSTTLANSTAIIPSMPSTTFQNSPLVEIVAELRWQPQSPQIPVHPAVGQAEQQVALLAPDSSLDAFFVRLGGELYADNFRQVERLTMPEFPAMVGQTVFRYRNADEPHKLFQAGPGIFTANGLPPYKSWKQFSDVVRKGVLALLNARDEKEKGLPFTQISLRYIDSFTKDLVGSISSHQFINDVLGFKLTLPQALRDCGDEAKPTKAILHLQLPLTSGLLMAVKVGDALVANVPTLMLDTHVIEPKEVEPTVDSVMAVLEQAHNVIHNTFFAMTQSIHPAMVPTESSHE